MGLCRQLDITGVLVTMAFIPPKYATASCRQRVTAFR